MRGSVAFRKSFNSPSTISRLISRPTTKKNTVISPSLTQWSNDSSISHAPMPTRRCVCQNAAKDAA